MTAVVAGALDWETEGSGFDPHFLALMADLKKGVQKLPLLAILPEGPQKKLL